MSSLQRYKKTGGFTQLLSLIESFPPQKKEKFLEVVEAESPVWAQALREKMLTLERIFSWPDSVVADVFRQVSAKTMAFFIFGCTNEQKVRFKLYFSAAELRRMDDLLTQSTPKTEEVSSTHMKVVETARRMITDRELTLDSFDPGLIIPEDFEATLELQEKPTPSGRRSASAMNSNLHAVAANQSASATAIMSVTGSVSASELAQLQNTLNMVLRENRMLKEELKLLHDKLDQIRRIA